MALLLSPANRSSPNELLAPVIKVEHFKKLDFQVLLQAPPAFQNSPGQTSDFQMVCSIYMRHVSAKWRHPQANTVWGRQIPGSWLLNYGGRCMFTCSDLFSSFTSIAWWSRLNGQLPVGSEGSCLEESFAPPLFFKMTQKRKESSLLCWKATYGES